MEKNSLGKLPSEELKALVSCIRKDSRVIIPPMVGYDSGVHTFDGKYIVVASDPCTGVPQEWFGFLLINYAASDVALSGAKPQFCTINLLGPKGTNPKIFQEIMRQTCKAADELDIAIVRGHTGMYDSVSALLGVATVYGAVSLEKLITPANAKPGDLILCTKPLGLETIINFSLTQKELAQRLFGQNQQQTLATQIRMQSCVEEAQLLAESAAVHAMHDATEGGLVAALNELAQASGTGFRIDWEKIPISTEVLTLKEQFRLSDTQLLSISSTGTIMGAIDPNNKEKIETVLAKFGLTASFIGTFTENQQRTISKNGKEDNFPQVSSDPYDLILSSK